MKVAREGMKLVFTFEGNLPAITFDATAATVSKDDAMMHGYEQKIRDNAAIARKQKDGSVLTVTEEMRRKAVEEMIAHLTTSADWNMRKSAVVKENATIRAIADKLGVSYSEAEAEVQRRMLAELSE